MARLARLVVPGLPHHITQRGNRRQPTFFTQRDYEAYLDLMANSCLNHDVEIWAYCLMPNHIHLIAVPSSETSLRSAVAEAHRRYTNMINVAKGWQGYLWQGRFSSFVMDEPHLISAARYIELNPVRAGLVDRPEQYQWSSARAHMGGKDDGLVKSQALLDIVGDWRAFLTADVAEQHVLDLHCSERSGRPLGSEQFIEKLEEASGRTLRRRKPGPKVKRCVN